MCELCEDSDNGEMQSCQDCGCLICFDVEGQDDVVGPAYLTASGDLFCRRCGSAYDRAEEEDEGDDYHEIYDPDHCWHCGFPIPDDMGLCENCAIDCD